MITSVYIDTDELVFQLHSVSDDAQKALEWVRSFRDTLMFGARIQNPLPFAMECMAMSEGFSASGVLGKLRAAARKRLNDEGIEATQESIDAEIARTQGADAVREIMAKIERANSLKAEIRRRKFTAASTHREAVDESTTGCNLYDQETKISTNRPDASVGNAEGVNSHGSPITRNGSRATRTSATSGQTFEALEQAGAGEVPPESVSAKPSPALPVSDKRPHGEFGNVLLTDDEFAKLQEKLPNVWDLIDELDQYIESQGKSKKYKSHYATLLNWSRRKANEAKPQQRYKNINDINQENYEKAMCEIEAMCAGEAV